MPHTYMVFGNDLLPGTLVHASYLYGSWLPGYGYLEVTCHYLVPWYILMTVMVHGYLDMATWN